jgi:hypothetical protein
VLEMTSNDFRIVWKFIKDLLKKRSDYRLKTREDIKESVDFNEELSSVILCLMFSEAKSSAENSTPRGMTYQFFWWKTEWNSNEFGIRIWIKPKDRTWLTLLSTQLNWVNRMKVVCFPLESDPKICCEITELLFVFISKNWYFSRSLELIPKWIEIQNSFSLLFISNSSPRKDCSQKLSVIRVSLTLVFRSNQVICVHSVLHSVLPLNGIQSNTKDASDKTEFNWVFIFCQNIFL